MQKVLSTNVQLRLEIVFPWSLQPSSLPPRSFFMLLENLPHVSEKTKRWPWVPQRKLSMQTDILPERISLEMRTNAARALVHQLCCRFVVSIYLNNLCDFALVYLLCFSHACLKSNMSFADLWCFVKFLHFLWLRNSEYLMLSEGKNIFYFLIIGAWLSPCILSWQNSLILKRYF